MAMLDRTGPSQSHEWIIAPTTCILLLGAGRLEEASICGKRYRGVGGWRRHIRRLARRWTLTVTNFGYDTQLRQFKQQTVWVRQQSRSPPNAPASVCRRSTAVRAGEPAGHPLQWEDEMKMIRYLLAVALERSPS
jgi:hypothetical protein